MTAEFYGEQFVPVKGVQIGGFLLGDLAEAEYSGDGMQALGATRAIVRKLLSPEDHERFVSVGRAHDDDPKMVEQMTDFVISLAQEAGSEGRPTSRPSGSSGGPRATSRKSGAGSSRRAGGTPAKRPTTSPVPAAASA